MGPKIFFSFISTAICVFALLLYWLVRDSNFVLFNPQGLIARQQMELIIAAILIMLVIIIPVTVMVFVVALKFREGNKKAVYDPDDTHSKIVEVMWWVAPTAIILILAVITWKNTYALDPYKPIESNVESMTIQVVAMRWKWLFLYPDQGIASVNYVQFPEDTPITFEITADNAPMSSFWIPSLGGQIYAMTGMGTKLNLIADSTGSYEGKTAEINGVGFSKMKFTVRVSSKEDFEEWVQRVQEKENPLTSDEYERLIQPGENEPILLYSSADTDLYNTIMMKYMIPIGNNQVSQDIH